MKPKIELIYDLDCPNIEAARAVLLESLGKTRLTPSWIEWDRNAPATPPYARLFGSPSILINGMDVAHTQAGPANCCRLYQHHQKLSGIPSENQIVQAVNQAMQRRNDAGKPSQSLGILSIFPSILAALIPITQCPACWTVYTRLLGAGGFGLSLNAAYLLPINAAFLFLVLASLPYRAGKRQGYGPLSLGLIAASAILASKFVLHNDPGVYFGLSLLMVASLWNIWPPKEVRDETS